MPDVKKVIKGLEEAVDWLSTETSMTVVDQWVVRDALTLLKAQEPVDAIPVEWLEDKMLNSTREVSVAAWRVLNEWHPHDVQAWQKEQEAQDG